MSLNDYDAKYHCFVHDSIQPCRWCAGTAPSWKKEVKALPDVDVVNHPAHYTFGKIEVIDVLEDWKLPYHLSAALKYIARAGKKDDAKQDLEKAIWYLKRYLEKCL